MKLLAFSSTLPYFKGMKLSSLLLLSLSWSLVVSCAEKKPEVTAVPKVPQVAEQPAATQPTEIPHDNLNLAEQLRDPAGMNTLEAANGARGATTQIKVVNAVETVEIPRPTNAAPTPPLQQVNLPEIPDKK